MITKETYTKPSTYERIIEIKCDMCGGVSKSHQNYNYDWYGDRFDINYATIEYKTGSSYPEGGHSTTVLCDICPNCFITKVRPWIESQGVTMREEECDW